MFKYSIGSNLCPRSCEWQNQKGPLAIGSRYRRTKTQRVGFVIYPSLTCLAIFAGFIAGVLLNSLIGLAKFWRHLAFILFISPGFAHGYENYIVDFDPLKQNPQLFQEYQQFNQLIWQGQVSADLFQRRIEIMKVTLAAQPDWVDGLWLISSDAFQLASMLDSKTKKSEIIAVLNLGKSSAERCLKLQPGNPLCQLFLGSAIAKKGTIEGVLASLDYAEEVEELWLKVAASSYNYQFTPQVSMQGAVRYALGIFYRLVPDYAILDWMYGVQGSLSKSVALHRESLKIDDGSLPCSNLMLGVALICYADDKKDQLWQEGHQYLRRAAQANKIYTVNSATCRHDAARIMAKPSDACSYSVAGQQRQADETFFDEKKKQPQYKSKKQTSH